jgi:hypothetical protein
VPSEAITQTGIRASDFILLRLIGSITSLFFKYGFHQFARKKDEWFSSRFELGSVFQKHLSCEAQKNPNQTDMKISRWCITNEVSLSIIRL